MEARVTSAPQDNAVRHGAGAEPAATTVVSDARACSAPAQRVAAAAPACLHLPAALLAPTVPVAARLDMCARQASAARLGAFAVARRVIVAPGVSRVLEPARCLDRRPARQGLARLAQMGLVEEQMDTFVPLDAVPKLVIAGQARNSVGLDVKLRTVQRAVRKGKKIAVIKFEYVFLLHNVCIAIDI